MSMNRVFISGFVGRDPEAFDKNDEKCAGFSLAENKIENGEKKTLWHQVSASGKIAERVLKHVKKGDKLVVEGRVTPDAYITKNNEVIPQLKIWMTDFELTLRPEEEVEVIV